jgi:hypothetical protein
MLRTSSIALALVVAAAATPASALTVTNLDRVTHRVSLSSRGAPDIREIAPNATEYFVGTPGGSLSLLSAAPKPSRSSVQSDGLLSGIIGAARNTDIPADDDYGYVIWPGGNLQLQKNRRTNGNR